MYSVEVHINYDVFHQKIYNPKIAANCFQRLADQLKEHENETLITEIRLWQLGEFGTKPKCLKHQVNQRLRS